MAVNARNGIALSGLSAINGVTSISAINGISGTLGGGGSGLTTDLIAYYGMTGTGDGTDSHGTKTLTEVGTVPDQTGPVTGEAARGAFTSLSNYLNRADDADFEPGSSHFSISIWVYPLTTSQASFPSIFSKYSDAAGQKEWTILWRNDTTRVGMQVSSNGSADTLVSASSTLSINTWYHIGACWDGTNIKMTLNGAAFTTTAFAGPLYTGTSPVQIGRRDGGSGSGWNGYVGPTAFWKGRALTLSDFQSIYNSGSGLPYSSW